MATNKGVKGRKVINSDGFVTSRQGKFSNLIEFYLSTKDDAYLSYDKNEVYLTKDDKEAKKWQFTADGHICAPDRKMCLDIWDYTEPEIVLYKYRPKSLNQKWTISTIKGKTYLEHNHPNLKDKNKLTIDASTKKLTLGKKFLTLYLTDATSFAKMLEKREVKDIISHKPILLQLLKSVDDDTLLNFCLMDKKMEKVCKNRSTILTVLELIDPEDIELHKRNMPRNPKYYVYYLMFVRDYLKNSDDPSIKEAFGTKYCPRPDLSFDAFISRKLKQPFYF